MNTIDERFVDRFVRRAMRGDVDAFGSIYDVYADRVYAFVRSRIGHVQDAEDVTEVVFLKAFEAIGAYDRRGLPFGAWLFRIARNAIVDHHRRTARVPEPVEDAVSLVENAADPVMVDERVLADVDAERLRECMKSLTEEQAAVLVARFFWDMDVRETAAVLGKGEGSVKALQHRAVRSLARKLEELGEDE